jgi:geranylgeranyl pyrophosphate synthase
VLDSARQQVDARLEEVALRMEAEVPGRLGQALAYALRSPGKRVRPALLLASYHACGGRSAAVAGLAAAVEVVHTYSLVHDDLPCMDDDQLRRGRPTTHVAFDLATATRVGYLLVPVAAEVLVAAARAMHLREAVIGAIAAELFEAGGIRGMVGGQWLDLEAEGHQLDLPALTAVHRGKTGALIAAAVRIGGLAAGAGPEVLRGLAGFGAEIGLAFQVADDVLDATASSRVLGKTAGKDAEDAKSTFVGLLGVEGARREAERHCALALGELATAGLPEGTLGPLARYIVTRTS